MTECAKQFLWWLQHDQNAPGIIQAISAIVTAILTAWLIAVTRRYTRLTKDSVDVSKELASIAANQLATTVQPELTVTFTNHMIVAGTGNPTMMNINLEIQNSGDAPVKIYRVQACVLGAGRKMDLGAVPVPLGKVLLPGASTTRNLNLNTGLTGPATHLGLFPFVIVDCTDLAEVTKHRFRYDQQEGLRHNFGFE